MIKIFLSILVAASTVLVFPPNEASAAQYNVTGSSCYYDHYNNDLAQSYSTDKTGRNFATEIRARFTDIPANSSLVIYQLGWSDPGFSKDSPNFRWISFTNTTSKVKFSQESDGKMQITTTGPYYSGTVPFWGNTSEANMPGNWTRNSTPIAQMTTTNNLETSSLNCIQVAQNVTYDTTWLQNYYPGSATTTDTTGSSQVECDPLDVVCHMRNIASTIGSGFSSLANGIVTGIAFIFLPDGDYFQFMYNELKARGDGKLGILGYPFEFLGGILSSAVVALDQTGGVGTCAHNFGDSGSFFGAAPSLDFCSFEKLSPSVFSTVQLLLQVATVLSLVFGIYHRWSNIMGREV